MTNTFHLLRLDGPASGERIALTRRFSTLGRHPASDLRFDAPGDGSVEPRHAAIFRADPDWHIRDLGSRTGTWVNGQRIGGDQVMHAGDRIRLGEDGPELRVEAGHGGARNSPVRTTASAERLAWLGLAILVIAGGWAWWHAEVPRRNLARDRDALLARIDSLSEALRGAQDREGLLGNRLATETGVTADTREMIEGAMALPRGTIDSLTVQVDELARRQAPLIRAAHLDLRALVDSRREAVALVIVERADGSVMSGTGFAVSRAGDTSWVVTSRHLAVDSTGQAALRFGLIFDGTAQNFRATLERVHPDVDLALLRVVVRGGTPVVGAVAEPELVGAAVATLTFPRELDLSAAAAWRRQGVTLSAFRATVTAQDANLLQLDGYGAEGMSGGPVVNASGQVVGVIFGGAAGSDGRVVYAVPAARIQQLLTVSGER